MPQDKLAKIMDKQDVKIKSTQELSFANFLDDTLQLSQPCRSP
jgi:hypothetical protein